MLEISVVVVCYNEERNLREILDSLVAQTYPPEQFEVIVVDNNSSDSTFEIASDYARRHHHFRVVRNPVQGIAPSRNVGLREARFEYVAFTDADCIVPGNWLEVLAEGMERYKDIMPELVAVGGGNIAADLSNPFLEALAITLNSFWGSHGSTQGMLFTTDTEVPHIPTLNILYEKQAVLEAGGFDESFGNICEDPELNHRLKRAGKRFMFLHDAVVRHKLRPDLRSWLRNVFKYGKGRSWLMRKHPDHFRAKFAVPPLILLGLALSLGGAWHWGFLVFPVVYVTSVALIALHLVLRARRPARWPTAFVVLAANPILYGAGQIYGALRGPKCVTPG